MPTYEETGRAIGAMVDIKNIAYGDSFKQADKILIGLICIILVLIVLLIVGWCIP